jgi:hypothetical protein
MTCNGFNFDEGELGIGESIPKVDGISCNSSSPKVRELGDSNSSTSLENNTSITLKNKQKGVGKVQKLKCHIN